MVLWCQAVEHFLASYGFVTTSHVYASGVLSNIVVSSLSEEGARRRVVCLLLCPDFVVSCFNTLLLGYGGRLSSLNEPSHEIMALFVLRTLILQTRMIQKTFVYGAGPFVTP